ncbi:hypothetical protein GGF46_004102 [Coemansia sp. RSA 552]|nr:hypothetical protein GGF46_004102 [Coemansia sp. RSA 552]
MPRNPGPAGAKPQPKAKPPKVPATASGAPKQDSHPEPEEPVCFICADSVEFYAVGQCGHRTCYRCSLRLRALFKSKACPYCKADLTTVIYTRDAEADYEKLQEQPLPFEDPSLGIKFDCAEAHEATKHALQLNCPHGKCSHVANNGWKGLKGHARGEHGLQFCDLCLKNKMSFAHEHRLFTKPQLRAHYARGDGTGFTGHPSCQFCQTPFYDNDQLFDHCRQKHEQCFICVRSGVGRQVYYANYESLEDHFNSDHYSCRNAACVERKFVVFENEIDLQRHDLEEHSGSIVGQKARREAKQVNVNFRYAPRGAPSATSTSAAASGSRSKTRAGRQRPATMTVNEPDATGVSIAGRQRPAGFGHVSDAASRQSRASTSQSAGTSSPDSEPAPEPEPEPKSLWPTLGAASGSGTALGRAPAGFGRLSINDRSAAERPESRKPGTEAMAQHQELLQRVSAFLSHREQPVERFRQLTTRYKDGAMGAEDYVQNCWLLFLTMPGKNAKVMLQKTMNSVAGLLPEPTLAKSLLVALGEHRIKQQQFPALTPLTVSRSSTNLAANSSSSSRVLVIKPGAKASAGGSRNPPLMPATGLKAATKQTPRPNPPKPQRPAAKPLSDTAFPSLGASSKPSAGAAKTRTANHNSYSGMFTRESGGTVSSTSSASDFPDLPSALQSRRKVVPLDPNAKSAWESANGPSAGPSTAGGKASKNKKQPRNSKGKQVLYHIG